MSSPQANPDGQPLRRQHGVAQFHGQIARRQQGHPNSRQFFQFKLQVAALGFLAMKHRTKNERIRDGKAAGRLMDRDAVLLKKGGKFHELPIRQ